MTALRMDPRYSALEGLMPTQNSTYCEHAMPSFLLCLIKGAVLVNPPPTMEEVLANSTTATTTAAPSSVPTAVVCAPTRTRMHKGAYACTHALARI